MESCHYVIAKRVPTVTEYQALRNAIGCEPAEDDAVATALKHSLFGVCAVLEGEAIGCCRVVGDGGIYFFIQDLMVKPGYEGEGIEECLMDEIMEYLKENAPPGAFFCIKGCKIEKEHCKQYGFTSLE